MAKRILIILTAALIIMGINKLSLAMTCGDMGNKEVAQAAAVQSQNTESGSQSKVAEVGNKICPVTGEKVDEKTKATYVYNGKIYNFCCSACIDEFKKAPEKYIKKTEEELKSNQAQSK